MSTNVTGNATDKKQRRTKRRSNSVTVNFVIGTLWLTLLEYSVFGDADCNVILDVNSELAALKKPQAIQRALYEFPSAVGTTIHKLANRFANPDQLQAISKTPNVSTEDGIGQIRMFGAWAVEKIMESADFEKLLTELPGELRQASGGELKRIALVFHLGIGGGQASRGGLLLLKRILQQLSQTNGPILDVSVHLVGSVSFSGSGFPRAQLNGSAAIVEWLRLLQEIRDDNVNINLFLSELPTVGKSKALRSRYLRELHSGFHGDAVQEHFRTTRTNRAASGSYGNITFIRTKHFPGFEDQEVATQVATTYLPKIKRCLEVEEAPAQFEAVEFEYGIGTDRYPIADCLVEACEKRDPEFLIAEVTRGESLSANPIVILAGGRAMDLNVIRQYSARQLLDHNDASERLTLLQGVARLFSDEIASLRGQIKAFERHLSTKAVLMSFEKLMRRNTSRRRRKLKKEAVALRRVTDVLGEMKAELKSLEEALPLVEKLDADLFDRVHRLVEKIEPFASHLLETEFERRIKPLPLSTAFPDLLAVSDSITDGDDAMLHGMCQRQ